MAGDDDEGQQHIAPCPYSDADESIPVGTVGCSCLPESIENDAEAMYFLALVEVRDTLTANSNTTEYVLRLIDTVLKKFCTICGGKGYYEDQIRSQLDPFSTKAIRVNCNHVAPVMFDVNGQVAEPTPS